MPHSEQTDDRNLSIHCDKFHRELPLVEKFKGTNSFTFIAGSSWGPDEDLFLEYFNNHPEMKLIIAPHVIDENHLVEIIGKYEYLLRNLHRYKLFRHNGK